MTIYSGYYKKQFRTYSFRNIFLRVSENQKKVEKLAKKVEF